MGAGGAYTPRPGGNCEPPHYRVRTCNHSQVPTVCGPCIPWGWGGCREGADWAPNPQGVPGKWGRGMLTGEESPVRQGGGPQAARLPDDPSARGGLHSHRGLEAPSLLRRPSWHLGPQQGCRSLGDPRTSPRTLPQGPDTSIADQLTVRFHKPEATHRQGLQPGKPPVPTGIPNPTLPSHHQPSPSSLTRVSHYSHSLHPPSAPCLPCTGKPLPWPPPTPHLQPSGSPEKSVRPHALRPSRSHSSARLPACWMLPWLMAPRGAAGAGPPHCIWAPAFTGQPGAEGGSETPARSGLSTSPGLPVTQFPHL